MGARFEALMAPVAAGVIAALLIDDFLAWIGGEEFARTGSIVLRVLAFVSVFLLTNWIWNRR